VQGEWPHPARLLPHNRALLDEVGEWEQRTRRRDILVDEQTLFDFYDHRVPAEVASARHFDRWWKTARRDNPELLTLSLKDLTNDTAGVSERDYRRSGPPRRPAHRPARASGWR